MTPDERERCAEIYSRGKAVNSILRRVASVLGYKSNRKLEALYSKTANRFEDAYDYFKQSAKDPSLLDECKLDEKTKSVLLETLKSRFKERRVKIRAYIEVTCYTYEGIDAVKDALKAGMTCGTETAPIKINLVASPLYVVTTSTLDQKA